MLKVECAASRQLQHPHRVFTGPSHEVARDLAAREYITPLGCQEGFMLSDGSFAHRVRAMEVALAAGQVLSPYAGDEVLFSYMLR